MDMEPEARGLGDNFPPPDPPALLPEKLVDASVIPALLDANYGPLRNRGAEIEAKVARWCEAHMVPAPEGWPASKPWPRQFAIASEADNKRTSDLMQEVAAYAGGRTEASGEVHEARRKVTDPLASAAKAATAWFNSLREGLRQTAATIDETQTGYLRAKAAAEQAERARLARIADQEARDAAEAARKAKGDEEAVAAAIAAEEAADTAQRRAEAPRADLVRSTSVMGTTTTLRSNWTWEVTDMMALVKAVAAGKVSVLFLVPSQAMINTAVRSGGLRECEGLRIFDDAKVARR